MYGCGCWDEKHYLLIATILLHLVSIWPATRAGAGAPAPRHDTPA
jgi:hypothetical protein